MASNWWDNFSIGCSLRETKMDPNENLKESLAISKRIINNFDKDGASAVDWADAVRLAELVKALDGWISNGGFLPGRWHNER